MLGNNGRSKKCFTKKVLVSFFTSLLVGAASSAFATHYYVDCSASVSGSGALQSSPWNTTYAINAHGEFGAGDTVFFKRGSQCDLSAGPGNEIKPIGSGTVNNVITFDAYGTGAKPIINQNGNGSIIFLENVSYWTIKNLKLVGSGSRDGLDKKGIQVNATAADVRGITIASVEIVDVIGLDNKFGLGSAGIMFYNQDENDFEFHNVLIENNILTNVHRSGIEFASVIASQMTGGPPPFTLNPAKKSTGIVIRNNRLTKIGGDGIVLDGTDGGIVENNILDQIAVISAAHNVAIWSRNAINSLFQSNVITNTRQHAATSDGQGLDADWWGFNNVFQYNFTKDNQGGFALLCTNPASGLSATERSYIPAGSKRAIFRYNISVNDGFNDNALFPVNGNNARSFFTSCFLKPEGIELYNNVFYVSYGGNVRLLRNLGHKLSNSNINNNIFYVAPGTSIDMNRSETTLMSATVDFRNNMMFGTFIDTPGHASNVYTDPQFIGPLSVATGFKPQKGSPAVNSGLLIINNGGRDFEATAVPSSTAPNRGAYQSTATP